MRESLCLCAILLFKSSFLIQLFNQSRETYRNSHDWAENKTESVFFNLLPTKQKNNNKKTKKRSCHPKEIKASKASSSLVNNSPKKQTTWPSKSATVVPASTVSNLPALLQTPPFGGNSYPTPTAHRSPSIAQPLSCNTSFEN